MRPFLGKHIKIFSKILLTYHQNAFYLCLRNYEDKLVQNNSNAGSFRNAGTWIFREKRRKILSTAALRTECKRAQMELFCTSLPPQFRNIYYHYINFRNAL